MPEPSPTSTDQRTAFMTRALTFVDLTVQVAQAAGREDLVARLGRARSRLDDPEAKVLIVGEFKQGKSSLVNALVAATVCPVDDDIATAVPTVVRWAETANAELVSSPDGEVSVDTPESKLVRRTVDINQLSQHVTEGSNPANEQRLIRADVGLPRAILTGGLALIDTPGTGGLDSAHATITLRALSLADAVVFVTDASQEFSEPELQFLRQARQLCPNIVVVLTKIDFYPEWRRIQEIDRGHLQRAGIELPIFAVSSLLRSRATQADSKELNAESGYPPFVSWLRSEVVGKSELLSARVAANDSLAVLEQLQSPLAAERRTLADPEKAREIVAELERAKEWADRLRSQAARWQLTLGDGIGDLTSDIDYDLRSRVRILTKEAEEAIDGHDPADFWDEFEPWLYRRCSAEVVANYTELYQRSNALASVVSEHFAEDESNIAVQFAINDPTSLVGSLRTNAAIELERPGSVAGGVTALRGSYGGILMVSFFGGLVGLGGALLAPGAGVVGLLMGRKTLKDERERQLLQRRSQAKNAMRKYLDELTFQVNKDSKDALRLIHRQLRDAFMSRADELQRSTTEALAAAQQAVRQDQSTREQRLKLLDGEIARLTQIRTQVSQIAPDLATAAAASGVVAVTNVPAGTSR